MNFGDEKKNINLFEVVLKNKKKLIYSNMK